MESQDSNQLWPRWYWEENPFAVGINVMDKLWPFFSATSATLLLNVMVFALITNWVESRGTEPFDLQIVGVVVFVFLIYFIFTLFAGLVACLAVAIFDHVIGKKMSPNFFSVSTILLSVLPQGVFGITPFFNTDSITAHVLSVVILFSVLGFGTFFGFKGGHSITTGKRPPRIQLRRQLSIRSLMIVTTLIAFVLGLGVWKQPLFTAIVIYVSLIVLTIVAQELTLENKPDEEM